LVVDKERLEDAQLALVKNQVSDQAIFCSQQGTQLYSRHSQWTRQRLDRNEASHIVGLGDNQVRAAAL
jgi:hypothetical protein